MDATQRLQLLRHRQIVQKGAKRYNGQAKRLAQAKRAHVGLLQHDALAQRRRQPLPFLRCFFEHLRRVVYAPNRMAMDRQLQGDASGAGTDFQNRRAVLFGRIQIKGHIIVLVAVFQIVKRSKGVIHVRHSFLRME